MEQHRKRTATDLNAWHRRKTTIEYKRDCVRSIVIIRGEFLQNPMQKTDYVNYGSYRNRLISQCNGNVTDCEIHRWLLLCTLSFSRLLALYASFLLCTRWKENKKNEILVWKPRTNTTSKELRVNEHQEI